MGSGVAIGADGRMVPRCMTTAELIHALADDEDDRRPALIQEAETRAALKAFPRWRLAELKSATIHHPN
jgi:hypothetical protein